MFLGKLFSLKLRSYIWSVSLSTTDPLKRETYT